VYPTQSPQLPMALVGVPAGAVAGAHPVVNVLPEGQVYPLYPVHEPFGYEVDVANVKPVLHGQQRGAVVYSRSSTVPLHAGAVVGG
jgi:hypothetical protein